VADSFTVQADQYYGTVNVKGNTSGAVTIDCNDGNYVTMTATGNFTNMTFSNMKAGARYVLVITQDGGGGNTFTPPTTMKFPGGVAGNILTAAASAVDVLVCDSVDGTNLLCNGLFDVKNP